MKNNGKKIDQTRLVEFLLGRQPKTSYEIRTRCPDGTPQVLITEPVYLEDNIWKPFPTFLWLVCPRLKKEISRLEETGLIKAFSQRLGSEVEFAREFKRGQDRIAAIRLELARKIYPGKLPQHVFESLEQTTIAGSKSFLGVKCLHAHVAQELVFHDNPIGKAVLAEIGICRQNSGCMPDLSKGTVK